MLELIRQIISHFQAFKVLVLVNAKTTVLSTRLGWLWWILDPLFLMGVYYFLIKGVFDRGGDNYHVFVLTGVVSWQFFTRSLTGAMNAIPTNKNIIQQIAFPLPILVSIPIIARFLFATIGMLIVILFQFSVVSWNTLTIFPVLLLIALFSYGIGLFISVINVFVSDIKQFITYVLRAGFFCTPILYPASRLLDAPNIPEGVKALLQLNPMMWIISALRKVLLEGEPYSWQEFLYLLIIMLIIIQAGLVLLRRNTSRIIKTL